MAEEGIWESKARKCLRKRKATPVGLDARATAHRPLKRAKRPTPVDDRNIEEQGNLVNLAKLKCDFEKREQVVIRPIPRLTKLNSQFLRHPYQPITPDLVPKPKSKFERAFQNKRTGKENIPPQTGDL